MITTLIQKAKFGDVGPCLQKLLLAMIIYQLALRQLTATFGGSWWLRGPASSQKQRLPTSNHQMVHGSHHPYGISYE